jgi:hypothetical protein
VLISCLAHDEESLVGTVGVEALTKGMCRSLAARRCGARRMSTHLHLELLDEIYRVVSTLLCEFDCNVLGAQWRDVCQLSALDPAPAAVCCCIHLTHCADNVLGA